MNNNSSGLSSYQKGVAFMLLSALGFALMNLMVRMAGDLPSMQKSFFRNAIAFLVALISLLRSGQKLSIPKGTLPVLLLRSALGTGGILCNYYAIDHLKLADASVLNKLSPFFVLIFSRIFLGERLKWVQTAAIVLAFGGVLFIVQPGGEAAGRTWPLIAGIAGGIMAGGAYTAVRRLGLMQVKGATIVAFFSGFSTLVLAPFILFDFHPMSSAQWLCLLGAGLAASIGQFGITLAYHNAPAREISIFDYSTILFSALLSFAVFNELPNLYSWIGYLIVFAAGYISYRYNRRQTQI